MGSAVGLREDFSALDLRALARRSGDAAQVRRLLALAVIYAGGTRRDAVLAAAFGDLAMGGKDAIHRADPTQTDAFIKQGCIDLGRDLVGEARGPQLSQAPDRVHFPAKHGLTVPAVFCARGGAVSATRCRCPLARDTASAAQMAAVRRLPAAITICRCRWMSAPARPARLHLFLGMR